MGVIEEEEKMTYPNLRAFLAASKSATNGAGSWKWREWRA